jgi:hypothetical protein
MRQGFRLSPNQFNLVCALFVALFSYGSIIPFIWNERPSKHDFGQFYMGGAIAQSKDWGSLYPIPKPGALSNAGWRFDSYTKPHYEQIVTERKVGYTYRFIQLPPNALWYYPLALMSVQNAFRVWHIVMTGLLVVTAVQAGKVYQAMVNGPLLEDGHLGRPVYTAGLVTLLVGLSPLMNYTERTSNTGPLISACYGAIVLGLLAAENRGSQIIAALGLVIGGFTKFAPGVGLPLMIAMRRWRTIGWTLGITAIITLVTMFITGTAVWSEFWRVIWPTLQNSSDFPANESIYGFLIRNKHQYPLNRSLVIDIRASQDLVLAAIALLLLHRKEFWKAPEHVAAAAAALMSWLLIFAPIAWQFYHCMLAPLWGWLIWEAIRGKWFIRTVVIVAILLTFAPSPGDWWKRIPEPMNSRQLFSAMLILLLGCWRLSRRASS